VCSFQIEQSALCAYPPRGGKPAKPASATDYSVTGDNQRDTVGGHTLPNRSGSLSRSGLFGKLTVGDGLAVRNISASFLHTPPETCQMGRINRDIRKFNIFTGGIFLQPGNKIRGGASTRSDGLGHVAQSRQGSIASGVADRQLDDKLVLPNHAKPTEF
jgi:hypothetical protein